MALNGNLNFFSGLKSLDTNPKETSSLYCMGQGDSETKLLGEKKQLASFAKWSPEGYRCDNVFVYEILEKRASRNMDKEQKQNYFNLGGPSS